MSAWWLGVVSGKSGGEKVGWLFSWLTGWQDNTPNSRQRTERPPAGQRHQAQQLHHRRALRMVGGTLLPNYRPRQPTMPAELLPDPRMELDAACESVSQSVVRAGLVYAIPHSSGHLTSLGWGSVAIHSCCVDRLTALTWLGWISHSTDRLSVLYCTCTTSQILRGHCRRQMQVHPAPEVRLAQDLTRVNSMYSACVISSSISSSVSSSLLHAGMFAATTSGLQATIVGRSLGRPWTVTTKRLYIVSGCDTQVCPARCI